MFDLPKRYPRRARRRGSRAKHMVPRAAPGEPERMRRFLNTAEHKNGRKTIPDRLRSRRDAEIWLPKLELLPAGTELTKSEVQRTRKLREALAARVSEARPADAGAVETLRDVAEGARFRMVFGTDGKPWVRAVGTGLDLVVASARIRREEEAARFREEHR